MKRFRIRYLLGLTLLAISTGCTPSATVTEPPPPSTSIDVAVDLVGPRMEVGASWLYADGTLIVAIPEGKFTQGHGGVDDPLREVTLPDYWIYSTEVTNVQYTNCVRMEGCTPPYSPDNPGFDDFLHANDPVVGVDHEQAKAYCSFVHARLPTEAEWEKAARGPEAYTYPWGNDDPTCDRLNYLPCKGNSTPVNTYPDGRSYYGAFDMAGNVFEWAADWYQSEYYVSAPTENPQGAEKGNRRVVRSSGFNSGANQTQVYNRFHSDPVDHRANLGFRCVVEDPNYFAPFCEYPGVYGTNGIGGSQSGESLKVDCPNLAIKQNPTCEGTTAVTYVDLNFDLLPSGSLSVFHIPPACQDAYGYPSDYVCGSGSGNFKFCSQCEVQLTTPPLCPVNYAYDIGTNSCKGKGTQGVCLPGSTPVTIATGTCCSFVPGTAGASVTPLADEKTSDLLPSQNCPAGTWQTSTFECISVPVDNPYCLTERPVMNSCTSGGGGGGDAPPQGCPAQSCETNYTWDSSSCSCVCDGC